VTELWRYPVKSLQGEQVSSSAVGPEGLEGDRRYAIFDLATGFGLTARRAPELLFGSARWLGSAVEISLPDGSIAPDDAALSSWLGRPVALRSTDDVAERRYENPQDFENEGDWEAFDGARGSFRDSAPTAVSLVSLGSLSGWDRRRFRSNVLLDGSDEDSLVGSRVSVGGAVLDVVKRVSRCVMVTRPQPGGIDKDLTVLRTVHRERAGRIAVGATVTVPGTISVGDEVLL
jgi:uncharacterized protein YcbX